MDINILVADDDINLRGLLCDIITKQGYTPIPAQNGSEAIDIYFSRNDISLCILDVLMPLCDGFQVLSEIRKFSSVPILMLTALGDETNEVKGLTLGADDFISKPFSFPVFIARVDALLRKHILNDNLLIGELNIDFLQRKIYIDNIEIDLTKKEFLILTYMIKNKNIVLERDKLIYGVWGYNFDGEIRTIDTHIKRLRSKLGICSNYIKTIHGIGYMFEVNK